LTIIKRLLRNPLSVTGSILVLFFVIIAIAAPWLAPPEDPTNPYRIPRCGYVPMPQPPNSANPLEGIWKIITKQATICEASPFGRIQSYDIYYGVIWGTRTAFFVGLVITGLNVFIGLLIGSISAYFGRWIDEVLMRITDVFLAFPFLVAAITLAAVLQPRLGRGLLTAMIALIVFGWMSYARLIRGDILAIKERDYVSAARAVGAPHYRILFRHIIPNAIYPTLVVSSMDIGSYVLSFAALSFLGLGAEIGYADWGQMISFARDWIARLADYWYIVVYPGIAILLFVLGWNLIGDAFRDILDPRLKGAR
jgi:peptide/nickel transport system permease protein